MLYQLISIKPIFVFYLLFLITSNSALLAQDYSKKEHKATPEWVVSTDFIRQSMATNLVVDSFGNTYSTGYFSDKILLEDSLYIEGYQGIKFNHYTNNYFLTKRDKQGTLLWIRYGIGSARSSKLLLDHLGNIYVIGQFRATSLQLSSTGDSIISKNKSYLHSNQSNIFICQYNSEGKVLRAKILPSKKGQVVNDAVLDAQGNFIIGGYYNYSNSEAPRVIKCSYTLIKLNATWDILWTKEGHTLGQSQVYAIAVDTQSNVYITGGFTKKIAFSKDSLKGHHNDNTCFVVQYNPAGEVQWILDSLVSTPTSIGTGISCDQAQNIYLLIHTQHSKTFLIKLKPNRQAIWSKTIEGSQMINGLLLTNKNHIYLFGNGYTGNFGNAQSPNKRHAYHNYDCYSFFIAKYNSYGTLLALNIEGQSGSNYCQDIALFKDKILVLGTSNAGRTLQFGAYTKKVAWYFNIWLASFYEGNFVIKSQD